MLNRIEWHADEGLDDVRDYVVEHLGQRDAVRIVDDTGFLKKGLRAAGVQRQYSGTAGRTEICQIGAFLAGRGRTLIDRRPTDYPDCARGCGARTCPLQDARRAPWAPSDGRSAIPRAFRWRPGVDLRDG